MVAWYNTVCLQNLELYMEGKSILQALDATLHTRDMCKVYWECHTLPIIQYHVYVCLTVLL